MNVLFENIGHTILALIVGGLVIASFVTSKDAVMKRVGSITEARAMLLPEKAPIPVNEQLGEGEASEVQFEQKTYLTGVEYDLQAEMKLHNKKGKALPVSIVNIVSEEGNEVEMTDKVVFRKSGIYKVKISIGKEEKEIRIPVTGRAILAG